MKKITIAALIAFFAIIGCNSSSKPTVDGDRVRELAGDLINRQLYKQAIDEYKFYLDNYQIEEREQANVNYIIANTYFERLKDYENALVYFLRVKHLYPTSTLLDDVNKKIVACSERTGRTEDALQALDEAVQLDENDVKKRRPGAVVAKIGNREITQGDIDFELSQLPPSVADQFKNDPNKKLDFMREYVATELLYDTASRAGLDKEPDIIEGAFQAKKALMVRRLLADRVAGQVDIKDEDVELYFEANKDKYAEKDKDGNIVNQKELSEVKNRVAQDLANERYQKAYSAMMEKMIMAEGVKFYESRLK